MLGFEAAHAQANDMFPTKAAEQMRARISSAQAALQWGWNGCPVPMSGHSMMRSIRRSDRVCMMKQLNDRSCEIHRLVMPIAAIPLACATAHL